jgi:hypothetical protein
MAGGSMEVDTVVFKQLTTNEDEQQVMNYLYTKEEERSLEIIKLHQFRGVLHQNVDASRIGWCSEKTHAATLAATTQIATHTMVDSTRSTKQKRTGTTHRKECMITTDAIHASNLVRSQEETSQGQPAKRYLQLYVELGKDTNSEASGRLTGFAMRNKSEFPHTLLDFFRNRFIPTRVIMDGAREQDSDKVRKIYRRFVVGDPIKSEPHHQYQNPAEVLGVNPFKRVWKTIEQRSALIYGFILPIALWLYQAFYVIEIINHRASNAGTGLKQGKTPIEKSGDPTPDISHLRFGWGQRVAYHQVAPFPLPQIRFGNSLGPSSRGNYLCQYILTDDKKTVISRSAVESVDNIMKRGFKTPAKPEIELRGGERGNPITTQEDDIANNKEVADMLDDFEPVSEDSFKEREAQQREFEAALTARQPIDMEGQAASTGQQIIDDPEDIYLQPCDFPDEQDENNEAADMNINQDNINSPEVVEMEDEEDNEEYPNPWLAGKKSNRYYVHNIVGRSDPRGEQVKVIPGLPEGEYCQKTERNRLWLLCDWGEGFEGADTYEPYARLKESTPQKVADYLRGELGDDPTKHESVCLKNAVRWTNKYLQAADESGRAFIQLLDASGYFETDKVNKELEAFLNNENQPPSEVLPNGGVRGESQGSRADPVDHTSMFKMGIEENAKVQYGKRVPAGSNQAEEFEKQDGNLWTAAAKDECVDKLCNKYKVFGIGNVGDECPVGYQEIKLKIVYTNSPEGLLKARCCAVGCGVDSGNLNRYFCVVDHTHARAVMTVALANGLQIKVVDVKSAYVTCRAQEKVWVRALPREFGEHAGKAAIVEGNLYGLNTAGAVWSLSCRAQLQKMGFTKSPHDGAVYYRRILTEKGPQYEYICTFVDDLILMSSRMDGLVKELAAKWEFKHSTDLSQGVRYVGADCKQDLKTNTLDISCETYIQEALKHIEGQSKKEAQRGVKTFNLPHVKLSADKTPMLEDDHPEALDGEEAEFLNEAETKTYQSYIGALQWCCTLCRIDIEYSVSALSSYNAAPRVGHARRIMRVWGYLKAHPKLGIRLDPSDFVLGEEFNCFEPHQRRDLQLDYGDVTEEVDPNDPEPLGASLTLTGFADADHAHNKIDRRSTTGRIILLGKGMLSWKSKRQVGCEGSSYGSELRATADTARELRGLRMFLRGIGVAVKGPSVLLVDNAAALFAASNLGTTIKVKHLSIDYHSTRELTAWGIIQPEKCPTEFNLADILTKPTDKDTFWRLILSILVTPRGKGVSMQRMTIC